MFIGFFYFLARPQIDNVSVWFWDIGKIGSIDQEFIPKT
jgi:MarR-like DNA-binding transcriptional regulator SgrR of sgrS sRNA